LQVTASLRRCSLWLMRAERDFTSTKDAHVQGRRVARASDAPSSDALRGILQGDAKRALDCAMPAPGNGHTHEEHAAQGARAHECLYYVSFARRDVAGRWLLRALRIASLFLASHDVDSSSIHSNAAIR